MKIATWNVNGIRARQAQLQEFVERERPDVVCLQEIKASSDQIPAALCEMEGYWCYWHGEKGYSGVGAACEPGIRRRSDPRFSHPSFDYENRIVLVRLPEATVVSVYVPNGGKDFPAKMRFLAALEEFVGGGRERAAAHRDLRRPEHRANRHGRPPEGAQAECDRPASGGARSARADHRPRRSRRHRPRAGARRRPDVHVVGAVAEHAPAEHRLAARLRARQRTRCSSGCAAAPSSARSARAITRRWSRSSGKRIVARPRRPRPPGRPFGELRCIFSNPDLDRRLDR